MRDLVLRGVLRWRRVDTWKLGYRPHHAVTDEPAEDAMMHGLRSMELETLTQLHQEMSREFHHNKVDIPVSVNLDDWIERIAVIIAGMRARGGLYEVDAIHRRAKAAFAEGYYAMRRQYHLEDDLDLAWEQSVSKQELT